MDRHLDDELLSAVLDHEASDDEVAHAQTCPRCSAQLARLRSAALAVAAPPEPPADAARRAAIARALQERALAPDRHRLSEGAPDRPRPIGVLPERGRAHGGGRGVPRWAVAAAIALVVGLAVPVIISRLGGGNPPRTATGLADSSSGAEPETSSAAAGQIDQEAPVDGGDLGELSGVSGDELASRVDATDPQPTSPPGPVDDGPVAVSPVPPAGQVPPTAGPCEVVARGRERDLGPLRYQAQGTVDGGPVTVLGFETLGPNGTSRVQLAVKVLSADTCAEVRTAPQG
ncbi:MAG: hypothetical protein ACR2G7_07465 [Acidimicrobiales bacterium]